MTALQAAVCFVLGLVFGCTFSVAAFTIINPCLQ